MGIDVLVESESGEVQDEVLDERNLTEKLLPDREDGTSPCLRFVDPNGETVFNQVQIPFLVSELEKRARASIRPELKSHAESILVAVKAAMGEERTYVRFSTE
jgi:hypothetical protein